jgi:H+/Cl- antiporter ClcA
VTRREIGILIIGIGLGLLLSLAVVLEVMLSLREPGSSLSSYYFDKIAFLIPIVLLLLGIILLAYRKKSERNSN